MPNFEKHPLHIKNPELQKSPEVEKAVKKQEGRTNEKIPNNPNERIEAYMDRLENVFLNPKKRVRERNLKMLRPKIYDSLVIKKENFPDSYFELQKKIARERGQAMEETPQETKDQIMEVSIEDQKKSLDAWMDYLSEEDVAYPTWFKYFIWRNIIKLSQFDKERGEFKKRTATTVAPYPDIYRDALAKILDVYEKVKQDNQNLKDPEIKESFSKKFPALYAELVSRSLVAKLEHKEEIHGEWIKYTAGNQQEADKLFNSVQGKGTGWCIEGNATSRNYIKQGDFYVFYTYDNDQKPTQPRLAIQMSGSHIGQLRGVLQHQEVEPMMQEELDKKLQEFGSEADAYRKKSADMKKLTEIEKKTKNNEELDKNELLFLYEIDNSIKGFGYKKDPRIEELRNKRIQKEDMLIIFECKENQVAKKPEEVNEKTKAYVGKLEKGIFNQIQKYNLEHIYTKFPEGKIEKFAAELGTRTEKQIKSELEKRKRAEDNKKIYIEYPAEMMLKNKEFFTLPNKEQTKFVKLRVKDFDFSSYDKETTQNIFSKAKSFGLELCPPEAGPTILLDYRKIFQKDQGFGEQFKIAMQQINTPSNDPHIFRVFRDDDGNRALEGDLVYTNQEWSLETCFVFRLRKIDTLE
jgi:hypothetical protein